MFKIQTNVRRRLNLFQSLISKISDSGVTILIESKRWIITERIKNSEDFDQTYDVASTVFDRYQVMDIKPPKSIQITEWERLAKILKYDIKYGYHALTIG